MRTLADEIAEDMEMTPPDEQGLGKLAQLIKTQLQLEKEMEEISYLLTVKQAECRKISEEYIPNMFTELHLSEFKMDDGSKVEVKAFYSASISEETREAAFTWLREHNLDDVIKHEVKVIFGKGEDEQCANLRNELERLKVNYIDKESVHPQTLKALVKERMEKMGDRLGPEEQLPLDTFHVFTGHKTKITPPKKQK